MCRFPQQPRIDPRRPGPASTTPSPPIAEPSNSIRILPRPTTISATALVNTGRLDDAEAAYRRTLALRPDYANAHSNLGVVLQRQDKFDEAIAAYNAALRLQPRHAEALSNLGAALREIGEMDKAVEDLPRRDRHRRNLRGRSRQSRRGLARHRAFRRGHRLSPNAPSN